METVGRGEGEAVGARGVGRGSARTGRSAAWPTARTPRRSSSAWGLLDQRDRHGLAEYVASMRRKSMVHWWRRATRPREYAAPVRAAHHHLRLGLFLEVRRRARDLHHTSDSDCDCTVLATDRIAFSRRGSSMLQDILRTSSGAECTRPSMSRTGQSDAARKRSCAGWAARDQLQRLVHVDRAGDGGGDGLADADTAHDRGLQPQESQSSASAYCTAYWNALKRRSLMLGMLAVATALVSDGASRTSRSSPAWRRSGSGGRTPQSRPATA